MKKIVVLLLVVVLVLIGVVYKLNEVPPKPVHEFALDVCIASTANISEYQHSVESAGYPVGRIKAYTTTGYYMMIYIPDLHIIGAIEVPYADEAKFQEVHCPQALGGE